MIQHRSLSDDVTVAVRLLDHKFDLVSTKMQQLKTSMDITFPTKEFVQSNNRIMEKGIETSLEALRSDVCAWKLEYRSDMSAMKSEMSAWKWELSKQIKSANVVILSLMVRTLFFPPL
jgi:hypothetical protein